MAEFPVLASVSQQTPALLSVTTSCRAYGCWKQQILLKCTGAMFFGPRTFDPVLIIAQIIAMQCLWYISLGCLLWLLLGEHAAPRPLLLACIGQEASDLSTSWRRPIYGAFVAAPFFRLELCQLPQL